MERRTFLLCAAGGYATADLVLPRLGSGAEREIDRGASIWPRPIILPIPEGTLGVRAPVLSLGGTWKISLDPPSEFWEDRIETSSWHDVTVPGQADRQGIAIRRGQPYVYRKAFTIPGDYASSRIFVRFEGVTGKAQAWLNGHKLEEHNGGFTIWNRELTDWIRADSQNTLTVSVTDPLPQRSSSGFDYGGILRGVKILAVPSDYFTRFHIDTDFDPNFQNANLKVSTSIASTKMTRCRVNLLLTGPDGEEVSITPQSFEINTDRPSSIEIPVRGPLKWDAEHPNLYTLQARLIVNGKSTTSVRRVFGFRKIEVSGRRLLVNGNEVKLHGGGRFDSNPLLGHTLSPAQCEQEVRMLKEANVNYIRPACCPAIEEYLSACDRFGMYVESETNVTFTRGTESDPEFTPLFMNQMAEMIEANRSHPSILLWSLGNESSYGINIGKTFEYTKKEDPSRPILFSWSHRIPPDEPLPYSMYSFHYPDFKADMGVPGVAVFNGEETREIAATMPVLHDEFAHGACYNRDELERDPNTRNFWGESIQLFWERMHSAEGCLGGAIWALVDETGPGAHGYPWGMIDPWRREKPEYWLMKKAYSPIRIPDEPVVKPGSGKPLRLGVKNWFNHTNLTEVSIQWAVGAESGETQGPDIPPGSDGELTIPARAWQDGELLHLVCRQGNLILDEYKIPIGRARRSVYIPEHSAPELADSGDAIVVSGADFKVVFVKESGSIASASYHGTEIIQSGPHFHLMGANLDAWTRKTIDSTRRDDCAIVRISGSYGPLAVSFTIRITGEGLLAVEYLLNNFPLVVPETKVVPWNQTNAGGFSEVGVSFVLSPAVDTLTWKRNGLWSVYPEDHIGRTSGTAKREGPGHEARANAQPQWPWFLDEKDSMLFGPNDSGGRGTNDFRSMKEYIYFASAVASRTGGRLRAESDANHAMRLEVVDAKSGGPVRMIVNNAWNYTHLGLGNYMKPPVIIEAGYTNSVLVRLANSDNAET